MSNYKLPLGLTRYGGETFDHLHRSGSGCITASSLPDLLGIGKKGRLALAAHILGLADMSPKQNNLMRRGKILQEVAAEMYAEETGRVVKNIHARIKHDDLPFYASPDILEHDAASGMPFPVAGAAKPANKPNWRAGEIKVVAESVFDADWDGGPPERVLVQHQGQLLLTGASIGPVVALVIGEFDMFIKSWDIAAHGPTQQVIEEEVRDFMAMLARGEMPPPDLAHEGDQAALIKLARAELDDVIDLPEEARAWIDLYQRYGKLKTRIDKKRTDAKARLIHALDGHAGGVLYAPEDDPEAKDLLVQLKSIEMKERVTKAHRQNRIYVKDHGRVARKAQLTAEDTDYSMALRA